MIYQPPTDLPRDLLKDEDMQRALTGHDFGKVFRLARERAGISYSKIAAECDIKPDRVGTLARGQVRITTFEKIVQIADALRVPGRVLGLAPRPWETDAAPAATSAFDGGRTRDAESLYEESRDFARDAQDTDLYGNSLAFLAYNTIADDRRTAVAFAEDSAPRSPPGRRPPSAPSSTNGSPGPAPSTTRRTARKSPSPPHARPLPTRRTTNLSPTGPSGSTTPSSTS
ncbi:helix-turn-helix domain-containing protein [Streptomyces sp. NBC_00353]|uniref:helix-turn-helix domain-containing protein n=1 Tax=Streptomyces sp. NBC_00353 TaxID=2975722 RepID=UPI002E26B478